MTTVIICVDHPTLTCRSSHSLKFYILYSFIFQARILAFSKIKWSLMDNSNFEQTNISTTEKRKRGKLIYVSNFQQTNIYTTEKRKKQVYYFDLLSLNSNPNFFILFLYHRKAKKNWFCWVFNYINATSSKETRWYA